MSHPSTPRELEVQGIELPKPRSARIGGDEFGVILPDTDRDGANVVANRLREAVADELKLPQNRLLAEVGVGVSIGVATLEPGMTASDLLRFADKAMYTDKLRQLRSLSQEEEAEFVAAIEHLEKAGVRPRDVPKYIQMLGASAVTNAFEGSADPGQSDS
jgi:GGDEF domain-containing protein